MSTETFQQKEPGVKTQRPILFSTPMVQAIFQNRKTITRRTKGLDEINSTLSWDFKHFAAGQSGAQNAWFQLKGGSWQAIKPPYKTCDILWVRESFHSKPVHVEPPGEKYWYKADNHYPNLDWISWKPSIHMPKAACRLFLEVINVRCERLQDISGSDAKKEGIEILYKEHGVFPMYKDYLSEKFTYDDERKSFQSLWQKINGIDSWDQNPWVSVIEFKRIEKPESF